MCKNRSEEWCVGPSFGPFVINIVVVVVVMVAVVVQAEKLMQDMLESGLTPNVITYTSLMVVLRKGGQYQKSIGILDLMRSKVGGYMALGGWGGVGGYVGMGGWMGHGSMGQWINGSMDQWINGSMGRWV